MEILILLSRAIRISRQSATTQLMPISTPAAAMHATALLSIRLLTSGLCFWTRDSMNEHPEYRMSAIERATLRATQRLFERYPQLEKGARYILIDHGPQFVKAISGASVLTGLGLTVYGIADKDPMLTGTGIIVGVMGGAVYKMARDVEKIQ